VSATTLALQGACALAIAFAAALVPAVRAGRVRIVQGLRAIG
jgi:putative ABC transport system permease protein